MNNRNILQRYSQLKLSGLLRGGHLFKEDIHRSNSACSDTFNVCCTFSEASNILGAVFRLVRKRIKIGIQGLGRIDRTQNAHGCVEELSRFNRPVADVEKGSGCTERILSTSKFKGLERLSDRQKACEFVSYVHGIRKSSNMSLTISLFLLENSVSASLGLGLGPHLLLVPHSDSERPCGKDGLRPSRQLVGYVATNLHWRKRNGPSQGYAKQGANHHQPNVFPIYTFTHPCIPRAEVPMVYPARSGRKLA